MSERVLVTGGAGFIGSRLVDALLARGDEVRVLDDLALACRISGYSEVVALSCKRRGHAGESEARAMAS